MDVSESNSVLLHVPVTDVSGFCGLMTSGGFFVAPFHDAPWASDKIAWQMLHVGRDKAIASANITVWHDGSELPTVMVTTYRYVLRRFCWPRDRRLVCDVVAWLLENGAEKK